MIYTSIPLPRSQISPDTFKDRGNGNEAPAPVGEVRISITRVKRPFILTNLFAFLWAFVGAFLTDAKVYIDGQFLNGFSTLTDELLFTIPPLIVNLATKSEDKEIKLNELGFSPQSSGRYKFFKGPANHDSVHRLTQIGVDVDCWAPYGSSNIRGFLALCMINRLLRAALGFISFLGKDNGDLVKDDNGKKYVTGGSYLEDFSVNGPDHISEPGYFFPYFNGLVLPDKAETPRILLGYFAPLMGSKPTEVMAAAKNLHEGWVSLSNTTAGLEISHLVFGLDLAIRGLCRLRPVFLNSVYCGFIISGEDFILMKGSSVIPKTSIDDLKKEISGYDSHGAAVAEIAQILSGIKVDSVDETIVVEPSSLQTPRAIHDEIRKRSLDAEQQASIQKLVPKLRYVQTLFSTTDKANLALLIQKIAQKGFLPASAPFYLKSGALFTKDHIFSTLAAFGAQAPTLMGNGTNTMVRITKGRKFYTDIPGSVRIEGIPVFTKSISQALEDFRAIQRSGIITFQAGMKDKKGFTKVAGVKTWIAEDSKQYKEVLDSLVELAVRGEKRDREDSDDTATSDGTMKKAKKDNTAALEVLGFLNPTAEGGEDDVPMDINADFFA